MSNIRRHRNQRPRLDRNPRRGRYWRTPRPDDEDNMTSTPDQENMTMESFDLPAIYQLRDAEIRVFDRAPGTDDASGMYVIEVLGVTVRVRLVTVEGADEDEPDTTEPYVTVEAGGRFTVSVNEDPHTYGDG